MKTVYLLLASLLSPAAVPGANVQQAEQTVQQSGESKQPLVLRGLIGQWKGSCRTWFMPGQLGDESEIEGKFEWILGGRFVRHTYTGTIQAKPRHGEEWIAYNSITKSFQSSWVDDFHMNYAILFSQGKQTEEGFQVRGEYDVGENLPPWGWRTEYHLTGENRLIITAYNIHPDGKEARAVEIRYERVR